MKFEDITATLEMPLSTLTSKYYTACCIIALAIALPIVLRPKKEVLYYFPNDIPFQSTTKEQFFLDLTSVDFQIVDLSSLPIDEYFIGKSTDQVVRGGVVAYNNLDGLSEYVFTIHDRFHRIIWHSDFTGEPINRLVLRFKDCLHSDRYRLTNFHIIYLAYGYF